MNAALGQYWMILLLAAGAVLGVVFWLRGDAVIGRRVYGDFIWLALAPLLVIFGLLCGVIALLFPELPAPIWQATIAGLVVASGWLTSAIFRHLDAARDKDEKLRDYHKAIFAEVQSTISGFDPGILDPDTGVQSLGPAALDLISRIERSSDGDPFVPMIPLEVHDAFHATIQDKIDILPRETIGAITFYYGVIRSIRALSEDMRAPEFRNAMDNMRRTAMYRSYAEMRLRAYWAGVFVLKVIQIYSEKGKAAAREFVDENMNLAEGAVAPISNPEAGRTGPEAGSA